MRAPCWASQSMPMLVTRPHTMLGVGYNSLTYAMIVIRLYYIDNTDTISPHNAYLECLECAYSCSWWLPVRRRLEWRIASATAGTVTRVRRAIGPI
eukprot:COSAG05_NODE_71_length_22071_cov_17.527149_14_plen_96_part_00